MIPICKVFMAPDVQDFVTPVIHSGYIGDGEVVEKFEYIFGEYIGNHNTVMLNSGTSAITMALRLAGVGHGDKVVTTPMTCLATNMAILSLGAIPVWSDILYDGTIDPNDAKRKSTGAKAILCVDVGGTPCELDSLKEIGLPVIEDACQALGSVYKGKSVGSDADYVCFSFQAIKYLTTGDGGMLVVNSVKENLEDARLMKWFGLDRKKSYAMRGAQDPPLWGWKFQSTNIAAAIGLANIKHLESNLNRVKRNAEIYNEKLRWLSNIHLLPLSKHRESSYWLYTVLVEDVLDFINYMNNRGVECSQVQLRNDKKTIFKKWQTELPMVDYYDSHHVSIPVGWWVHEEEANKIARWVEEY